MAKMLGMMMRLTLGARPWPASWSASWPASCARKFLVLEGLAPEGLTKISASSGFQCLRPPRADLAPSALAKPADDRVEGADAVRESDVALLLAPPAGGSRTAPRSSRPARFAPPAHKPGRCLPHLAALSQ